MTDTTAAAPDTSAGEGYGSANYRGYVLGSLLLVYIFNFIDRTMISIVGEPIIKEFGLTDTQFGLLSGFGFALLYTFLGIPIARLAERFNRVWIIGVSVLLWSVMTALGGFANGFLFLLAARIGVGIGEAGCTPPANSLIGDYFKPSSRPQALAIYAMGITIGVVCANLFVGLAGSKLEWREIFKVVGLAGIPVGLLVLFTMKEPPRGYSDPPGTVRKQPSSIMVTLKELSGKPTFWHVTFGATLASFVGYGMGNFTVSFLSRTHGMTVPEAALNYMVPLGIGAAIGTWLCGFLVQKLTKRHPRVLVWLPAIALALITPAYAAAYNVTNPALIFPFLMIANIGHYFYLTPMYAVGQGVVGSESRATAVAVLLFVVNIIGYGLGPLFVGKLSDMAAGWSLKGAEGLTMTACKSDLGALSEASQAVCKQASADGLQLAITVTILVFLWAGLHFLLAMRSFKKDMVANQT